jgi:hypothetical protein
MQVDQQQNYQPGDHYERVGDNQEQFAGQDEMGEEVDNVDL